MRNRKTAEGDVFIATFNEKTRTVSDDHLTMIFAAVGARHGYEDVGAEFAALEDFKVKRSSMPHCNRASWIPMYRCRIRRRSAGSTGRSWQSNCVGSTACM